MALGVRIWSLGCWNSDMGRRHLVDRGLVQITDQVINTELSDDLDRILACES